MTIQEMIRRKKELGYSDSRIAELSGISVETVTDLFQREMEATDPGIMQALEAVLRPEHDCSCEGKSPNHAVPKEMQREVLKETPKGMLREPALAYGRDPRKKHTIEDYYALPDDRRVELIDGVFYDMTAPAVVHQLIIGELHYQLKECEKKHPGNCRVILSPCDVQLYRDRYNMFQPDLLVVCDKEKLHRNVCYGAPDLTVEVMSPTSRSHDSVLKLRKYREAGVREYWIIDPQHKKVIVYDFEHGDICHLYDFTDRIPVGIPVGISGGTCSVNFASIEKAVTL